MALAIRYTLPSVSLETTWLRMLISPHEKFQKLVALNDDSGLNSIFLKNCAKFGRPWTHCDEQHGSLIQDVRPHADFDGSSNYFSANHHLSMHQDYFFEETPPSLTFIWCIQNEEQASTVVVNLRKAFLSLSEENKKELMLPNFAMADYSSNHRWKQLPVAGPDGKSFRYDEDLISPLTETANYAWQSLIESVRKNEHDLVLAPNDVLLINNRLCAHGRRSFSPLEGEGRRWLKRCLVLR